MPVLSKQRVRFPVSAYSRRILRLQEEIYVWRRTYQSRAALADTPVTEAKLLERATYCDELYHLLEDVNKTLWFWQ